MCDTFLSNLYTLMNDDSNTQYDYIPSVFLFSGANCTGDVYPNDCSGGIAQLNPFITKDSKNGTMKTAWSVPGNTDYTINYTAADPICKNAVRDGTSESYIPYFTPVFTVENGITPPAIKSFIVPFNIRQVQFRSAGNPYYVAKFNGPITVENTELVNWQGTQTSGSSDITFNNSKNMFSTPINAFIITESYANDASLSYLKNVVKTGCMGKPINIGGIQMTRYIARSARCDSFMSNQYCVLDNSATASPPTLGSLNTEECSCFSEQETLLSENAEKNVVLPVICFGIDCATKDTYKTRTMTSLPCNATVCQSTIKESGDIKVENEDKIYCGGRFYNNLGTEIPQATAPVATKTGVKSTDKSINSFYAYIMLGAAAIFLALFVYLLLAPKPSTKNKVLDTIEQARGNIS